MTWDEAKVLPRVRRPAWTGFHVRTKDMVIVWRDGMVEKTVPFKVNAPELAATDWESC